MIYQSYNFVDSYSNASGNRKNSMVLGELGKVVKKEPKAIISALQDAGVKVPANSSRRDLVRLIIANKRNKRLVQNLSVLITASGTYTESFSNMMDGDDLSPLPLKPITPITNPNANKTLATGKSTEKGGFFKSIGDFFQKRRDDKQLDPTKKSDPQEESRWKRFSQWFTKNRDTISQVGNTLYTSLGTANQNDITNGGGGGNDNSNAGSGETWIQRNKILVVVGLVAVAGGIYFMSKKKK